MDGVMRIGELARRSGVSPEVLRAWERRYGLLRPSRSGGGFRLYSAEDEARVRRTTALIADGLSAGEAAREAMEATARDARTAPAAPAAAAAAEPSPVIDELAARLRTALDRYATFEAHAVLDQLLALTSVESAIADVFVPYLHELGERWRTGEASVAQEHFASQVLRGRLLALARDTDASPVPGSSLAVLAALPGEMHDLGLLMLAILAARRGWRIVYLGADTPLATLAVAVDALRPSVVVTATLDPARFAAVASQVSSLAERTSVAVGGRVDAEAVRRAGARLLPDDIVLAAAALAP